MNELTVFKNEQFGNVRTTILDNEPYFVLADVCKILELKNPTMVAQRLEDDERAKLDLGRQGEATVISESGLYAVILRSDKPQAKLFRKWVTSEVLPTIRKTGQYIDKPTPDDKIAKDLAEAKARNARAREASLFLRLGEKATNPVYRDIMYSYSTKALSGEFLLPLPAAPRKTYSATEIGEMLGISANRVGRLAESNNLKTEQYGTLVWDIAPNTHKQVQSFRYYLNVLEALRELLEVA